MIPVRDLMIHDHGPSERMVASCRLLTEGDDAAVAVIQMTSDIVAYANEQHAGMPYELLKTTWNDPYGGRYVLLQGRVSDPSLLH